MEYVILDMEWDSAFFVPEKRFINQILQIGAVRLDDKLDITDTLSINIRSGLSKRVTKRFTALTGITKEDMLSGVPIEEAVERFNRFAGDDCVVMTWSDSDLYTIIENERCFLKDTRFRIKKYLDLQKYVQNELRLGGTPVNTQISLGAAAEMFNIKTDDLLLHTAKDDSTVCALLLKKCYNKERFEPFIKNASDPEFYHRLYFKSYYIKDFSSPDIPRETFVFNCESCGGRLLPKGKWRFHNNSLNADLECENCKKKYIARVFARKTYDDVKIRRKLVIKKKKDESDDMQPVPAKV